MPSDRGENFVEVSERVGSLDLRNNERLSAQFLPQPSRTASMSAARSTNDWLTASTPRSSANSRQARSCFGKRADAQDQRREGLVLCVSATRRQRQRCTSRRCLPRPRTTELHEAVVEKDLVTGLHHARQLARSSSRHAAHRQRFPHSLT